MPIWPWKAFKRPMVLAVSPEAVSASSNPFGPLTTQGSGANGAKAAAKATGPEPGPPPPWGVENVLCRFMCMTSMPRSAGRTLPTMALKLAPSQ